MKRRTVAATALVALLFMLTLGASRASASTLQFQLTSDHCTNSCLPNGGSAGTVTITDLGGGSVSVNVTLNSGFGFVDTGFAADFGFNLAGTPTLAFSNVTSPWFQVSNNAGSLQMDGTGIFEYGLLCSTGQGNGCHPNTPITAPLNFTITAAGLSTASFIQNVAGQYFSVDLIAPNGNTGGVDASGPSVVPDGGMTLMLLGGTLVGLATLRRRFSV
jgi:hypothetical protein